MLTQANTYTDEQDTLNRTDWAAADAAALSSANAYSDQKFATADAYRIMPNLTTEDLNTIVTPGIYPQSSNTPTGANYPTGATRGDLWVTKASATVVSQKYWSSYTNDLVVREGVITTPSPLAVTWSTWKTPNASLPIMANLALEDLNTITTPGIYAQSTSGNATFARNYPFDSSGRGILVVKKVSASIVSHEYLATFLQKNVVREYNGTTWNTWKDPSSGGGGVAVAETKLVGTALNLSGGPELTSVKSDYAGRLLLDYGVTIPKWRLHIRNYNVRDSIAYPGVINLVGFTFGEAEMSSGTPTGRWVSGTTSLIQGAASTPADGSEWVSNWFTTPILSHKKYMLSYGFTADAAQQVHHGFGAIWNITAGSTAAHTAATYGSRSTMPPLDIWMECEVPATTMVKGVVGDSRACGHSATSPVHDSWLAQHCRTVAALPVFWAASGDSLGNFADATKVKATRYDGMAKPDVVYMAMGGNDISSGIDLTTMQSRYNATIAIVKSKATVNIVLVSLMAHLDTNDPAEDVRQAYNNWLEMNLPAGGILYKDINTQLMSTVDPRILDTKWTASPTNIHLSTPGYARVAAAIV